MKSLAEEDNWKNIRNKCTILVLGSTCYSLKHIYMALLNTNLKMYWAYTTFQWTNLWELRLGEPRLAHLRRLAHVHVALRQRPLGEGLGRQILAGLAPTRVAAMLPTVCSSSPSAVSHVAAVSLTDTSSPTTSTTARLTFHTSTPACRKNTTVHTRVLSQHLLNNAEAFRVSSFRFNHLMWVHWPVLCSQVEVWGASQGWRVWGCSRMSLDWGLFQSYQSGHGSGNTYWTYVLWWKELQVNFTVL